MTVEPEIETITAFGENRYQINVQRRVRAFKKFEDTPALSHLGTRMAQIRNPLQPIRIVNELAF
jgi:hypothetical protein